MLLRPLIYLTALSKGNTVFDTPYHLFVIYLTALDNLISVFPGVELRVTGDEFHPLKSILIMHLGTTHFSKNI
jgi:hypothetical protein